MKTWPETRQCSMKRPLRPKGCKYSHSMGFVTKGLASLFAAFLFCLAGTAVMWCTSLFQDLVTGTMVISNSSNTWDWWRAPPVTPLLMVYIFNYTNADSFGRDGSKLRVQEVGPFTYEETTEKVNVQFYPNSTLSYQENKTYTFRPDLSPYPEDAKVFVPNIPFMSALATAREESWVKRVGINTMLRLMDSKPLLHIPTRDLLFGYEDSLFNMAKFTKTIPYTKFGLMVPKVGVSDHVITMHTGADDMNRLGQIVNFNGETSQGAWRTDECNRIEGSDGSQFPPPQVSPTARLFVYNRDMCRRLPLVFDRYTEAQGMPAYRFHLPPNVFDNPGKNPDNECFCHHDDPEQCLPSGVFNSSACNFDAPLIMSFPHFLHGDPALRNNVIGLNPDPEKHDMFVDIHRTLGLTIGGTSRLQLNVQVRQAAGVLGATMTHFKDLSILPVAWFELKVTDFPSPLKTLLYHATFTVHILELLLMYGFLAGGIASAAVLCRRLFLRERGTLDLSTDSPDSDSA
ncbi:lysosome membrane protein 2-like isoform X2 [Thrips palmi]|uniref:Scavenger receptor class B member 1 n=1 Tax=Thrips palmi TaxID=161013 RepID=A0A6P8YNA5_THRPL|nr:lysosome membrane protein 2-like isoform X2 [Thrips palmi]